MKTQLNPQAGQVYQMSNSAFIVLLSKCEKSPNVYDKDGKMNYWNAEWYNYRNGKPVLSEQIQQIRMDGFGNPQLLDELPKDKTIYLRSNPKVTGSGCDGHRYSSQEIVLTKTGEVIGIYSWEEYRYSRADIYGREYDIPEGEAETAIEKIVSKLPTIN